MPIVQEAHMLIDTLPEEKIRETINFMKFISIPKLPIPDIDTMTREEINQMVNDAYEQALASGGGRPVKEAFSGLRARHAVAR